MIQKSIIPIAVLTVIGGVSCTPTTQTALITSQPKKKATVSKKNIQAKVTKVVVDQLGVTKSDVTLNANFTDDLGADSLDTVELIMALEEVYNISVPDADAEKIETVGQAVDYIYYVVSKKQ